MAKFISENGVWHIIWVVCNIIFMIVLVGAIARQDIEIKRLWFYSCRPYFRIKSNKSKISRYV